MAVGFSVMTTAGLVDLTTTNFRGVRQVFEQAVTPANVSGSVNVTVPVATNAIIAIDYPPGSPSALQPTVNLNVATGVLSWTAITGAPTTYTIRLFKLR